MVMDLFNKFHELYNPKAQLYIKDIAISDPCENSTGGITRCADYSPVPIAGYPVSPILSYTAGIL